MKSCIAVLLHTVNTASAAHHRETRPLVQTNTTTHHRRTPLRSSSAAGSTPSSKRRVMPSMSLRYAIDHIRSRPLILIGDYKTCSSPFRHDSRARERPPPSSILLLKILTKLFSSFPLETLTWYSIDAAPFPTACLLSYAIDSTCPRPLIAREERRLQTVPSRDSPAHLPGSMASTNSIAHLHALQYAIHPSDIHPSAFQASGA